MDWVRSVSHVVSLGTPHRGAPLEEIVHVGSAALNALPETQAVARFLRRRSGGIRDLRRGSLVDEDWQDRDPDALRATACKEIPLLDGAKHCFVSASITRSPRNPLGRLIGDMLVLGSERSAVARGAVVPPGRSGPLRTAEPPAGLRPPARLAFLAAARDLQQEAGELSARAFGAAVVLPSRPRSRRRGGCSPAGSPRGSAPCRLASRRSRSDLSRSTVVAVAVASLNEQDRLHRGAVVAHGREVAAAVACLHRGEVGDQPRREVASR